MILLTLLIGITDHKLKVDNPRAVFHRELYERFYPKRLHPIWEGLLISAVVGLLMAICLILLVAMLISWV